MADLNQSKNADLYNLIELFESRNELNTTELIAFVIESVSKKYNVKQNVGLTEKVSKQERINSLLQEFFKTAESAYVKEIKKWVKSQMPGVNITEAEWLRARKRLDLDIISRPGGRVWALRVEDLLR
jgi:hypothetical protein